MYLTILRFKEWEGALRRSSQEELMQHFEVIEQNASAAQLRQSSTDKIQKAKRVCPGLVATISFFWMMVSKFLESLSLLLDLEKMMRDILTPAYYLTSARHKQSWTFI